ncbi:MAG: hypothetical protein ACPGAE_07200 [Neptuniibacter sp.]
MKDRNFWEIWLSRYFCLSPGRDYSMAEERSDQMQRQFFSEIQSA